MKSLVCAILMTALTLVLGACDAGHSVGNTAGSQAPPPVSHTVFAPYVNDVNKAKQLQDTVNAQKQALDRAIQAQTGATRTPAPSAQSPR
ncbi:MAG: hypothetical protein KGL98_01325 [Gammaproteobacteria bacterium]|nr:hypothetical protein [Gammaproteobacteria bacterium]MBU6508593.1 hypothetical protein [Gammaproteobacteria bacterium]MDE1983080.1 hypothetical protein [Gammaproteobacteria bacterium]MDE2107569.1 hypothetical protein [Gammaproteobacteria bacterium]MDE2459864.1 hypothetical protein [Gammaproteobacteria bacterium]